MNHQYNAGRSKRVLLSLLAAACLVVGSPVAAANAASGGAQKPVSATHGDCKNDNAGKHKGYVCPSDNGGEASDSGSDSGSGAGGDAGDIFAS
jgi:hypothetical protein